MVPAFCCLGFIKNLAILVILLAASGNGRPVFNVNLLFPQFVKVQVALLELFKDGAVILWATTDYPVDKILKMYTSYLVPVLWSQFLGE